MRGVTSFLSRINLSRQQVKKDYGYCSRNNVFRAQDMAVIAVCCPKFSTLSKPLKLCSPLAPRDYRHNWVPNTSNSRIPRGIQAVVKPQKEKEGVGRCSSSTKVMAHRYVRRCLERPELINFCKLFLMFLVLYWELVDFHSVVTTLAVH